MPEPIKILHILNSFTAGGMENGLVNIINRSPDHLVHELCLLTEAGDFLHRLNRPVVYHELHRRKGNDPRLLVRLHRLIRQKRPQVIHTRNWGAFDAVLASSLSPQVALLHGEHGRDYEDPQGRSWRRNLLRRCFAFRIRKFIAVSKDLYRWLADVVRIPERKLVFIPNGVDISKFQPSRSSNLKHTFGIAEDEFVVGSVGRLDPIKNHEGLIRAVHQLNAHGARIRLVIAGEGSQRARLQQLIDELHSVPRPILTGYRTDVAELYGLFDTFVLNSFGEGMSNTLLESMAAGLPIICTPVGGNCELITPNVNGTLVPVGDDNALAQSIRAYQISAATRSEYGANARRLVERNFSLCGMTQRYFRLYEASVPVLNRN